MKAKRRGVTSSDSASKGIGSAFGGFGAKMVTTKPSTGFSFEAKTGSLTPCKELLRNHYVIGKNVMYLFQKIKRKKKLKLIRK